MARRWSGLPLLAAVVTLLALMASAAFSGEARAEALSVQVVSVQWGAGPDMREADLDFLGEDLLDWWQNRVDPFMQGAANGAFDGLSVSEQVPEVRIEPPPSGAAGQANRCEGRFFDAVVSRAREAMLEQFQADPTAGADLVAYYWGPNGCLGADGRPFVSQRVGQRMFFQGNEATPPVRELARFLGLRAADALRCRDASGNPVTVSANCTAVSEGDSWDILGSGLGVFSAPALDAMGWLSRKETVGPCVDCERSFAINPLGTDPEGGSHAVMLQDGTDGAGHPVNYWIEYRQQSGLDNLAWGRPNRAQAGVVIHRQVQGSTGAQMIDVSPQDGSFETAALQQGQTWVNPLGTMQVEYATNSEDDAIINVRPQGTRVPDVRGFTQNDASAALIRAGFGVKVQAVFDRTCNHVGDVMAQNPAPRAFRLPGEPVTIHVGIKDPSTACPDRTRVLFMNVGWSASATTPASALVPSGPRFAFLRTTVNDYYTTVSHGTFPGFEFVSAGDPMAIDAPPFPEDKKCKDVSAWRDSISRQAIARARARGIDVGSFDKLFISQEAHPCDDITGIAFGENIWVQEMGLAAVHELGHQIGLGHANLLRCFGTTHEVPLSATCTEDEYGDVYDPMGNGGRETSFSGMHLDQLGWLAGRKEALPDCDCTVTRVLKPLTDPAVGLQVLKLVDGDQTFWLEYRQQAGIDADGWGAGDAGLVVSMERDPQRGHGHEFLLDMKPNADGFALPVGQTWANPFGKRTLTVDSMGPLGVSVTVGTQLVSVPSVRGMDVGRAADAIRDAGLRFGGQQSVIDPTCNLIGRALGTNPSSGVRVRPGSSVTVNVGSESPTLPCK